MKSFNHFVGIDVSKDSFVVSCKNESFVFSNNSFEMTKQGFELFEKAIDHFKKDAIVGIEPSGIYHFNLLHFLQTNNYIISMVNPYKVKQFFKFFTDKPTKTDNIDSKVLAHYIEISPDNSTNPRDEQKEKIKYLVREKQYITQQIACVKSEIRRLLCVVWPEIEREFDALPDFIISILKIFPSAASVRSVSFDKFKAEIEKIDEKKGRKVKLSLDKIYQLATDSIAAQWNEFESLVKMKIEQICFFKQQLVQIDQKIKDLASVYYAQQIKILTSIPGIGIDSAIYFMSEVQDITRFASYKKLIGFCGLDPTIKQSGRYKGKFKISKRGNSHARRIAYLMAEGVRKNVPEFKEYYNKKRNEGKTHTEATIACSTKLLKLIYFLLSENRVFI